MISVQLLVKYNTEFKKVTQFRDETITLTSSIQNVIDIGKTFTDLSQTFTVPADSENNIIFKHWYENFVDNSINANLKLDALLYIDTKLFRSGSVQLNKATIEDGKPKNYSITFFGKLVTLKDLFKEDKLISLQTVNSLFSYNYTATDVIERVKDYNDDVKFPLISSSRYWNYGTGDAVNDISLDAGAILTTDLFPALRVKSIFDAIATKYGIVFNSTFFGLRQFTELFLHLKRSEDFTLVILPIPITFGPFPALETNPININPQIYDNGYFYVNRVDNTVFVSGSNTPGRYGSLTVEILTNGTYRIEVYKNAELYQVLSGISDGFGTTHVVFLEDAPSFIYAGTYTFKVKSNNQFAVRVRGEMFDGIQKFLTTSPTYEAEFEGMIDLLAYMPDMKVIDFIAGIIKMFNLTVFNESDNIYRIETLDNYYSTGQNYDLTDYIEDKNDLERIKGFSKVNFKYQKSENFMNSLFLQNNGVEYGELQATFNSDGGQYDVTLPFENILFNRLRTGLQVGYYLKTDYITKLIPKPVLLYRYGVGSIDIIKIKNVQTNAISSVGEYISFGQDIIDDASINHSINFGYENSSLLGIPIERGLYFDYYQQYLANVYNVKGRNMKVKAKLTPSLILNLRLNDRIILFQKAYLINQFTTDLTTGIVNLDLLSDFRSV